VPEEGLLKDILDPTETISAGPSAVGGKAWNLTRLTALGYPVPAWVVISAAAWDKYCPDAWSTDSTVVTEEAGNRIRSAISKKPLSEELRSGILCWLKTLAPGTYIAVRSSVSGEDSEKFSFAGQMDSFLFLQTIEQVVEAVKKCWVSAFSDRALQYRFQNKLEIAKIRPAVILQEMIDGDVSGVLFTAHPTKGQRGKALLTAAYGLGEGIVSGIANTDEFTVDYETKSIEASIARKDTKVVLDPVKKFGTVTVSETGDRVFNPCLSESEIHDIVSAGRSIAGAYGRPMDVEWTMKQKNLYILQARPITRLPNPQKTGRRIVWDNSNIQESYCGVTTPLTFSFASRAYATVYEGTMRLMKIQEDVIADHRDMLQNLLGFIQGRVYYNINNWYRGLLLLPSFKTNKTDMERMMGLEEPVDFVSGVEVHGLEKLRRLLRMAGTAARLLIQFRRLNESIAAFRTNFRQHEEKIRAMKFFEMEPNELWNLVGYLCENILQKWQTPIVNDVYVMMENGSVMRRLKKAGIENVDLLQNQLLSGENGLESTEPTKLLIAIAGMIRSDNNLIRLIEDTADENMMIALSQSGSEVYEACKRYIRFYGDRVIGELKLETTSLRENSGFMFLILRNYVKNPNFDATRYGEQEAQIRREAETDAFKKIRKTNGRWALGFFKNHLRKWRAAVKNRESMRLERTRLFGMFRDIFLALGTWLADRQIIKERRDIFYLTMDELAQWVDGRLVQADFQSLIGLRKKEFESFTSVELPNRIESYGPVYPFRTVESPKKFSTGDGIHYKGLGCYPGVVEGEVKLIMSPLEAKDLNGHILVTLRTDPGWTPLFPSCKGIIVERGSSLSHSAVIARELGIPTIVAVPDITKHLKTGDRVELDGSAGTIRRL